MNQIEALEKVLDHLSLEEVIKLRAVSLGCRDMVDNFRAKSLCYSEHPREFIYASSMWVNGPFVQNFIYSTRLASFFRTFGPSILSNLRHLRLIDIVVKREDKMPFTEALNSFGQLKELDLVDVTWADRSDLANLILQLNLPILHSFRIRMRIQVGLRKIVLDTPSLKEVRLETGRDLQVELVHIESVEKLVAGNMPNIPVKNMKNLKYLYSIDPSIDSTYLAGLDQLKELHLYELKDVSTIFEQKQRYGRTDLKVYLYGCLLSGPDSPLVSIPNRLQWARYFAVAAAYPSELADELPFDNLLFYPIVERVAPELQNGFLSRFTNLDQLVVNWPRQNVNPVQNVQHFLDLLNSGSITSLHFESNQPQDLFDRLPEHCPGLQNLTYKGALTDFQFLARLHNLRMLCIHWPMDAEWIRRVFELPFCYDFRFRYNNKWFALIIERKRMRITNGQPERISIVIDGRSTNVVGVNAAFQLIFGNAAEG